MDTQLRLELAQPYCFSKGEAYDIDIQIPENLIKEGLENQGLCLDSKKIHKKRDKYQKIDDTIRQKLIDAVVKEGQMLKTAAKKYKINYSSAKSIFHTYRKEGRVHKKSLRDRYIKQYSNVKPLVPLRVVSQASQASSETSTGESTCFKQMQKFMPHSPTETILPHSLNLNRAMSMPMPSTFSFGEVVIPKLNTSNYLMQPNSNSGLNPLTNSILQNTLQQTNNLKLCEELSRIQSMISSTLSFMTEKSYVDAMTAQNYQAIPSLQKQIPMLSPSLSPNQSKEKIFGSLYGGMQINQGLQRLRSNYGVCNNQQ